MRMSEFSLTTSLGDTDTLIVLSQGNNARISFSALRSQLATHEVQYPGSSDRFPTEAAVSEALESGRPWGRLPEATWSSQPASTTRITMYDTTDLAAGMAVRFVTTGGTRWAVIRHVEPDSYIDISGGPADGTIQELAVGKAGQVSVVRVFVPGEYGATTGDVLDGIGQRLVHLQQPARVVDLWLRHGTPDSSTQPQLNVYVGALSSPVWSSAVQPGSGDDWGKPSGPVDQTYNRLLFGSRIRLEVVTAGGTGDAADLSAYVILVLE